MKKNIAVTGCAGYIGSHAVKRLCDLGHNVVAIDNLSRGDIHAVDPRAKFEKYDLRLDRNANDVWLYRILEQNNVDCVMHFAALALVKESVDFPLNYYDNNVGGTMTLLRAMQASGCHNLIFSSTCATYGQPQIVPVDEHTPQCPENPYGTSKLMCEQVINDFVKSNLRFSATMFRYFNVVGVGKSGFLGAVDPNERRLFTALLDVATGAKEKFVVNGVDYDTKDGTCIRDYIHVEDVVDAHIDALEHPHSGVDVYNLGTGQGYSILEAIEIVQRVTNKTITFEVGSRKPGDPAIVYANADKANRMIEWKAKRSLEDAVRSMWEAMK